MKVFRDIKRLCVRGLTIFLALLIAVTSTTSASAAQSFDEYALSPGYTIPRKIVSASGYLWSAERSPSGNIDALARIGTSGGITNYSTVPTGYVWSYMDTIVAGPDGNIWFTGCAKVTSTSSKVRIVGKLDTVTGATTAQTFFSFCDGGYQTGTSMAVGPDGNIWFAIADTYGSSGGILYNVTVSGPMTVSMKRSVSLTTNTYFTGMITGPDGSLWLGSDGNKIRKMAYGAGGLGAETVYALPAGTSYPDSFTVGPDGNIWFRASGGIIGNITPSGAVTNYMLPSGSTARELTAGPDGALWYTQYSTNKIGRITTSGATTEYTIPTSGGSPYGIVAGPDNALWFTENGANKVGRLPSTPFFDEYALSPGYTIPRKIVSASGYLWSAERSPSGNIDALARIGTSGGITNYSTVPTGYVWSYMDTIVAGPDGNIWFTGCAKVTSTSSKVRIVGKLDTVTGATTAQTFFSFCDGGYQTGTSMAVGPDGNIWFAIADTYGSSGGILYNVTVSGPMTVSMKRSVSLTTNTYFTGMITGPDGSLWLGSDGNKIRKMAYGAGGLGAETVYALPAGTSYPDSFTVGPDGNIWFRASGGIIGNITPSGAVTNYMLPSGSTARELTAGPDGALWYTQYSTNKIGRITTSGATTEYTIPTSGGSPYGIVAGPDNALWFTENGANKVGRLGY